MLPWGRAAAAARAWRAAGPVTCPVTWPPFLSSPSSPSSPSPSSPSLSTRPLFTATAITYHKKARVLEVELVDDADDDANSKKETHRLSAELLRIASPSIDSRAWAAMRDGGRGCFAAAATTTWAAMRDGGGGENEEANAAPPPPPTLGRVPAGRKGVGILKVEPVGNNYAVRLTFDDLHASGLYTWDYLRRLSTRRRAVAREYLAALRRGGGSRDPRGGRRR